MSLKKVAEIANVSVSTASRVLTGKDEKFASKEVCKRVWDAAKAIGYCPNVGARDLKTGGKIEEKLVIATALARVHSQYSDEFFYTLDKAVGEEIIHQGCVLAETKDVRSRTEINEKQVKPSGIIVLGRCPTKILQKLIGLYKNVCCISLNPNSELVCDQVVCNGYEAADQAMEYLVKKGYSSIGYVGECANEQRFTGYLNALIKNHIPFDKSIVFNVVQEEAGGQVAAAQMLEMTNIPKALFCANDITAIGVISQLKAKGVPLSEYPAIISIDDIAAAQAVKPMLTTIRIPTEEMARFAVRLMLDRLRKGHREVIKVEFPSRLIKRQSS